MPLSLNRDPAEPARPWTIDSPEGRLHLTDWEMDQLVAMHGVMAGQPERRRLTPHAMLPRHCGNCGQDWPERAGRPYQGVCTHCNAGLPCRADTTDRVAPDEPCRGSRLRAAREAA